ncbi:MAG: hypothetical protein LUH14_01560 [Clostridiaceae bacterium]|nr:hypothetical protein [Clostridiaceae bacterium]
MSAFLNKLERKFGRYAIPDLIKYVVAVYCAGAVIGIVNADFYYSYLALDFNAVFHGQIWRLVTFLLEPGDFSGGINTQFLINIVFFLIKVNLFFMFGRSLEQAWGTFRFNMYFFSGYLLNIIAALLLYASPLHLSIYDAGFEYIYWAMFLAFAVINPNMQFLLYFIIPIKVKWLAILDVIYLGYQIVTDLYYGMQMLSIGYSTYASVYFSMAAAIIVSLLNFLIYFFATRNYQRIHPKQVHRRREFRKQTQQYNGYSGGARHRCAVCGRTELDDPSLEFRYCSKCDGNYEYCSDHLFTHQHVRKM